MMNQGVLQRISDNKFILNDLILASGDSVDIQINGIWLSGFIELFGEYCCWYSLQEFIPVILKNGIVARVPDKKV